MRIPLKDVQKVVAGSKEKGKPGEGGDAPDVHVVPDGTPEPQDEMVDGDEIGEEEVQEGSDEKNTKDTQLGDPSDMTKRAQQAMDKEAEKGEKGGKSPLINSVEFDRRDYKSVLKEVIGTPVRSGARSYVRPVRRTAALQYPAPGRVTKPELGNIILALDTSGSITPGMLSKFIGNAQKISEQFKHQKFTIRIVLYIERVYKVKDFSPSEAKGEKLSQWLMQNINMTGGNYFPAVADYLNNMPDIKNFKGILYLTDGFEYFDRPFTLPPMKNIFLITGPVGDNYGNTNFLQTVQKQTPDGKKVDIYQVNI
jgi:predicted metal-dependent peptidase